jgi:hypothetical protein
MREMVTFGQRWRRSSMSQYATSRPAAEYLRSGVGCGPACDPVLALALRWVGQLSGPPSPEQGGCKDDSIAARSREADTDSLPSVQLRTI